jgi:hypothetical protein
MTKQELFKKYFIDESHNVWDNQIDNWMSIEIYRIMHEGNLPPQGDTSVGWITEFLDKVKSDIKFFAKLRQRRPDDFGSLFLTAKRMVYLLADQILMSNKF